MSEEVAIAICGSRSSSHETAARSGASLILLLTDLFAIALACKRLFHALLLTWLQIKRMTLHFLDDVFRLHFALESAQRILKWFAFLYSNLSQKKHLQTAQKRLSKDNLLRGITQADIGFWLNIVV